MPSRDRIFRFFFLSVLSLAPAGARAAQLSVVVDESKYSYQKVIDALQRELGAGNRIRIHDLRTVNLSNPVAKGRFLSQVAAADLIIPIGDPASRLVAEELEDLKTFFIAAGGLSGEYLGRPQVGGILSYSPEETVRVAKALLPELNDIGVLYTPGYEAVMLRMESAAEKTGLTMTAYRIASRREVGPAARTAAARADLLWVVGDPLLTQDLIFSYLLQESLRSRKPLAAPLPALVGRGSLFCTVPDGEELARLASAALAGLLTADLRYSGSGRVQPAPDEGAVLVNHGLAEKWGIRVPASLRLWKAEGFPGSP